MREEEEVLLYTGLTMPVWPGGGTEGLVAVVRKASSLSSPVFSPHSPLQEDLKQSAIAEPSSANPQVLHQTEVLHLVPHDPLIKHGCGEGRGEVEEEKEEEEEEESEEEEEGK